MNVVGPASRPRLKWLDGLWFQFSARVPVQVEILSVKKRENLTLCSCLSFSFNISLTELELIEICSAIYILTYFVIWISFQTQWMRRREYCAVPYSETPLLICGKHVIASKSFSFTDTPTSNLNVEHQPWSEMKLSLFFCFVFSGLFGVLIVLHLNNLHCTMFTLLQNIVVTLPKLMSSQARDWNCTISSPWSHKGAPTAFLYYNRIYNAN